MQKVGAGVGGEESSCLEGQILSKARHLPETAFTRPPLKWPRNLENSLKSAAFSKIIEQSCGDEDYCTFA